MSGDVTRQRLKITDEMEWCDHIRDDRVTIISISATEIQCMDCLMTWPKEDGFVSDFTEHDRG